MYQISDPTRRPFDLREDAISRARSAQEVASANVPPRQLAWAMARRPWLDAVAECNCPDDCPRDHENE